MVNPLLLLLLSISSIHVAAPADLDLQKRRIPLKENNLSGPAPD
jgi:hypothetical protein